MSDSPTKSFSAILVLFWDILCLRRGPADLPASWALLGITIVAQACLTFAIADMLPPFPAQTPVVAESQVLPAPQASAQTQVLVMPEAADHSLAVLLIDLVVMLLWGWAVLRAAGRPERFVQTMTAFFGCQLLLQPVLAPTFWVAGYYGKEAVASSLAALIAIALSIWGLIALVRVLRAATGWSAFACVGLVIGQGVLATLISVATFPDLLK